MDKAEHWSSRIHGVVVDVLQPIAVVTVLVGIGTGIRRMFMVFFVWVGLYGLSGLVAWMKDRWS